MNHNLLKEFTWQPSSSSSSSSWPLLHLLLRGLLLQRVRVQVPSSLPLLLLGLSFIFFCGGFFYNGFGFRFLLLFFFFFLASSSSSAGASSTTGSGSGSFFSSSFWATKSPRTSFVLTM